MKAFLSYTHTDKEIVDAVAHRVGRPFVQYDTWAFKTGDDLVSAMDRAVQESAIFVLFLSKPALDSVWVTHEMNEARYHSAAGRIKRTIVVLLDDRIGPGDLPEWLRRAKYVRSRAPRPIARVIRHSIDEMVQEEQHHIFVGRAEETAEMQAAFVPHASDEGPPFVVVHGLPGVGRRTLLHRVASDSLEFDRLLTVKVEAGDSINDLAIKLADLVEPIATPEKALDTAREIARLPPPDAQDRILDCIETAADLREMVVLYDDGGLLANDGTLTRSMRQLLDAIANDSRLVIAAVTNRQPRWQEFNKSTPALVSVRPLQGSEVRQLLALLARKQKLDIAPAALADIVGQVRGYPPSAFAAIQLVKSYGVELATGSGQAEYQPRPLNRYLASLEHGASEKRLLSILARNSPIPLEVLTQFVTPAEEARRALKELIDASLVVPRAGSSWYGISEPVVNYVDREYPACTVSDYAILADSLDKFLADDSSDGSYLDLSRVLYRALTHAGKEHMPRAYALSADWLRLAEEFYHQRNYERALELAQQALNGTSKGDALSWVVRAKVKLGDYDGALDDLRELKKIGEVRDAHFYRGFLERNRGKHREAIKHYELARSAGRGGLALKRDLAECYFQTGQMGEAQAHIEEAQRIQSDNPYVVNLRVKIACKLGDEHTARSLLDLLDQVDSAEFAAHRRSRVELQFGDVKVAYTYAKKSVAGHRNPSGEALSNLALCELRTNRIEDATRTIERLAKSYERKNPDVVLGLQARLAIATRRYEDALAYCKKFEKFDNPVHLSVRKDALSGLLVSASMSEALRAERQAEIAVLENQLIERVGQGVWYPEPD